MTDLDHAVEQLLEACDPSTHADADFRAARFDRDLAWLQFRRGNGGRGLTAKDSERVQHTVEQAGAAPADPTMFFMHLAAPTIAAHGTEEQCARFLRPMFIGQERWCQLFSEPGAGSDLANVSCRADRDGDEWVVNGQKVWNTLAHLADRAMLITRTDPTVPKHKGMTYFALDMRTPGVEVRPLRQLTGEAEFNEVYLTDVRIPDADRIGAVGDGWRVALATLTSERLAVGGEGDLEARGGIADKAIELWRRLPAQDRSPVHRAKVIRAWATAEVARLTNVRLSEGVPGPLGSMSKITLAEVNRAVWETCLGLLGPDGQVGFDYSYRRAATLDISGGGQTPQHAFLRSRANSIEGGTTEVLKNILGEQVLGLPPEPRVDKTAAWSAVPR